MRSGYHKIRGWVKRFTPTATSWGRGDAYGIAEQTIYKLVYQFGRSLACNDDLTFPVSRPITITGQLARMPIMQTSSLESKTITEHCWAIIGAA